MNKPIFFTYYLIMLIGALTGIIKYKTLDNAIRMIVMLLLVSLSSELVSFFIVEEGGSTSRYVIYQIYSPIEIVLMSLFFIKAINPLHYAKLIWATCIGWFIICILNILFLQPLDKLNSNILLLESFSITTMSLYYIYWLIKNDNVKDVLRHPHFQLAVIFLINWSGTFFFWAFIQLLFSVKWPYVYLIMHLQALFTIVIYSSIALILFFYPKSKQLEND